MRRWPVGVYTSIVGQTVFQQTMTYAASSLLKKHDNTHCWLDAGPPSTTLVWHEVNVRASSCVYWDTTLDDVDASRGWRD